MSGNQFDIAVLGAGIVGVATAIHLQRRGVSAVLVDRRGPGEETSFGNAGIIQSEAVHPYLFPRDFAKLVDYAFNRRIEAHYHLRDVFHVAPFLFRYWRNANPKSARATFEANVPLFGVCRENHDELAKAAGSEDLIRRDGWLRVFRSGASAAGVKNQIEELRSMGMSAEFLDQAKLESLEPHVDSSAIESAVHYSDPWTVSDPGGLVHSYARLFISEGGEIATGEAGTAVRNDGKWKIETEGGAITADGIVVALGPWSRDFLRRYGVDLPMGVKRGYHRHYSPTGNAYLKRPLLDDDVGYVMAPMRSGIRLTSGAEFARRDAPGTPVQLERALPRARELFPLGEPVEGTPWMGSRPAFPDMLPAIGPVEGLPGAFVNFGHAHHGFTLGPAVGKLLAQVIAGDAPFCDPAPYSPDRFRR